MCLIFLPVPVYSFLHTFFVFKVLASNIFLHSYYRSFEITNPCHKQSSGDTTVGCWLVFRTLDVSHYQKYSK